MDSFAEPCAPNQVDFVSKLNGCRVTSVRHGNQCQLGASQASKLEPDGGVGPSIIAHTLCNIAGMCKQFRAASRQGCKRLAEYVPVPQ